MPRGKKVVCEGLGAEPPKIFEYLRQLASRNESDNRGR
jgi:hypothetical protein